VEFELLGHPPDGPTLQLDHERFAYAGKFVMDTTGTAVVRDPGGDPLVGATAFSPDRDDLDRAHIRYVTVREDRRGEGIGPRLLRFTAEALGDRFEAIAIGVNNPIAYQACYRAGFVWTGRETGLAELGLSYAPDEVDPDRYRAGFGVFDRRDLPDPHRATVERNRERDPPPTVDPPEGSGRPVRE